MGNISFNPMVTTGISDAFVTETGGYVQGTFLDDPANRYNLEGGKVAAAESSPIWGGMPLSLAVPAPDSNAQGPDVTIASSLSGINAWSLFNQAAAGIITPSSNVPLYSSGMSVNFARPGSNLRIVLPVENSTVLNALSGDAPNVSLYWDPTNNCLTNTSNGGANYGPLPIQLEFLSANSKTVSYNSGTGIATWQPAGSAAVVRI